MRTTVTVTARGPQDPFVALPALGGAQSGLSGSGGVKHILNAFQRILEKILHGGLTTRTAQRPKIIASTANARGTVTFAAVQSGDTVTINGQALTATQHRASGTVTCASVSAADTVTVNGVVFTAVSGTPAANEFDISGTDTAAATSLAAAITASTSAGVDDINAKSAAAVVTAFALTPGTGGDAYTLASSNGTRLAVSGATFANGAAVGNNEFDFIQTDALNAATLSTALAASTTAIVSSHVVGNNIAGVVTCASVAVNDYVLLAGEKLSAIAGATDSGGARVTTVPTNLWSQAGSDTADGDSLVNCINAHPRLRELYFASNSSGVVTIRERNPTLGGLSQLESSNGTRLAVTGTSGTVMQGTAVVQVEAIASGHSGNAITLASSNGTRLAVSAARLAGGTSTTYTF